MSPLVPMQGGLIDIAFHLSVCPYVNHKTIIIKILFKVIRVRQWVMTRTPTFTVKKVAGELISTSSCFILGMGRYHIFANTPVCRYWPFLILSIPGYRYCRYCKIVPILPIPIPVSAHPYLICTVDHRLSRNMHSEKYLELMAVDDSA